MAHDLIVVGGGPAGSACARRAAQRGLDVIVVEKAEHPRRKVCGGAIRPEIRDLLDFDVTPAVDRIACGAHLFSPSRTKVVCARETVVGYTVKREVFDKVLLDRAVEAGAELRSSAEVVDVTQTGEEVVAHTRDGETIRGSFLVGADGVNSRVARSSGIKRRWKDDEIGLCIEARVPMEEEDIMRITEGPYGPDRVCIQIYFGGIDHGYAWAFPKRGEVSLGMGCLMPYAAGLRRAWERFTREFSERYGVDVSVREEAAMRVPLKGPIDSTVTGRVLLAGDAGGFVSPATGEGIYYAIETGQIAADTVADILQGDAADTGVYEQRWRENIGRQLDAANYLAGLLFKSQKNMERIIQMAARDDVMRSHLTELVGSLRPYTETRRALMRRILTHHPLTGLRTLL
ncbi:MAG: NAD(P)/FAD-dependent oxidoreductase [Candidatus Thorarchaeota archaeon]